MEQQNFNPRSPHGERPAWLRCGSAASAYFNPRSPHGERQLLCRLACNLLHFNPRSPHGERLGAHVDDEDKNKFQSTLPARGATFPHRLHRGDVQISIHAPRTGSDGAPLLRVYRTDKFQSTLPARGATKAQRPCCARADISIHAPRTGSDTTSLIFWNSAWRFQSTLPARGATGFRRPI